MPFFVVVITCFFLGYGYIAWRLLGPLQLGLTGVAVGSAAVFSIIALSFAAMLLPARYPQSLWPRIVAWAAYLLYGIFAVAGSLLVIRDLALLGYRLYTGQGLPLDLVLLNNLQLLTITLVCCAYGLWQARRTARVKRVTVPVENLHPDLEGFRIAQISDVHVSSTIRKNYVEKIVARVNSLEADLVAVTGDLVDGSGARLREHGAPLAVLTAREGGYFVPGNHDFYSGALAWLAHVKELGMQPLVNEHVIRRRGEAQLLVGGVTDPVAANFVPEHKTDPHRAIAGAPDSVDYRLLLAHQPVSVFAAADAGFDLQLSGHTHAGQFFPATLVIHFVQPFVEGLDRHENTHIYVNPGTGYWGPPLRLGAPSEITLLTLKAA